MCAWVYDNIGSIFSCVFREIFCDSKLLEQFHFQELLNVVSQRTLELSTQKNYRQMPQRTDMLCRILKLRTSSLSVFRDNIFPTNSVSCTNIPSNRNLDNLHWPNVILYSNGQVIIADGGNHIICFFDMSGVFLYSFRHDLLHKDPMVCINNIGEPVITCWSIVRRYSVV